MGFKRNPPRVRDEVRFHRDRLIEDWVASGMERQDAERRAALEFGNVLQIEEACRDVRGRWLEDLSKDLQYAFRLLRRTPGSSAVIVLSLALGLGANTAIFSLINAAMLRQLPVAEPDRLVRIARLINEDGRPGSVSYPLFEQLRDNVRSISGAFVQQTADASIVVDGEDDLVKADLVSGEYFAVLGLQPAAGRLLGRADDAPSSPAPAAVISDGYWERRFGRGPSVLGKTFTLRDRTYTIVGVTPPAFRGATVGRSTDVVFPLLLMNPDAQRRASDNSLSLLARLKPGATVAQANAEAQVLYTSFLQPQAAGAPEKSRSGILRQRITAFSSGEGFNPFRDEYARSLLLLMGMVALVLMLACVNVSGLLLARAAAREREISIRLAMGAGRGRLARQLLTETLLLASMGGAAGLALAGWFSARLLTLFVNGRDFALSVAPDWRVLAFTVIVSLMSTCIAGLAPVLQALRVNCNPALKEVRARGLRPLGKALVVAQLAISMVLVVGATLFVGTLVKLYAVDPGFSSQGLLVVNVRAGGGPYAVPRARAVQANLLELLRLVPGVESASAVMALPVGGGLWDRTVRVEGYEFRPDEPEQVGFNAIAPGYFTTLGTPVVAGREFDARDTDTSPKVAVVNESFARYFFGDRPPIGRHVTSVNVTYEIVGVVRDAKYKDLRESIIKTMYIPWTQREEQPSRYSYLARTAAGDPMRLAPALDRLVRAADRGLRLRTARPYAAIVDQSIAIERIMATLGGFFGILALVIAALGMFGVLAFQVARRTNELGVRMALGATARNMMALVLRDVAMMVAAGVAIGTGVALTLTGLAGKILFGLTPTDASVFAVAAGILALVAIVAGWAPARRAARVDPLIALRHE
jgi:predicted permease